MQFPPTGEAEGIFGQVASERLGKFPLLSVIGTGSMGIVYKSFDPQMRRPIALKTIRRELLDDAIENFSARFRIEVEAVGSLRHPGIVSVYEHGEAEGYAYLAMEYVEGHSLRDCFERKVRFNTDQAIDILAQLLKALQHAHEHGVWHRDVKPANLLLMSDGQVKVTDFGIARVESLKSAQAHEIMGTPGFIAPEMYLGAEFDHRIDLFAAGVVLYQLLAGVPPFVGTAEKIMFKVCYETPLPASVVARQPSLRPYDAVVHKALARRPEERFSSAAEFLEALLMAHTGGPIHTDATVLSRRKTGTSPDEPQITPRRRASDLVGADETRIVPRRRASDLGRADETQIISRGQPSGPVGADETQVIARREASESVGLDQTVVFPRRPTTVPPGANETVIASRRPTTAPATADQTMIIPRDLTRDDANLTIIRRLAATDSPVTEPLSLPQTLKPSVDSGPPQALKPFADNASSQTLKATADYALASQPRSTNTSARSAGWDAQELTQIEKQLARLVGPIAQVWMRAAARETSDRVSLMQALAARITNPPDREAFVRITGTGVASAFATGPVRSNSDTKVSDVRTAGGTPLTPEYIARAAQLLAVHLGPIAKILAKRAAQPDSSQEQFVATLAAHLNDDGERARFLKSLA